VGPRSSKAEAKALEKKHAWDGKGSLSSPSLSPPPTPPPSPRAHVKLAQCDSKCDVLVAQKGKDFNFFTSILEPGLLQKS